MLASFTPLQQMEVYILARAEFSIFMYRLYPLYQPEAPLRTTDPG